MLTDTEVQELKLGVRNPHWLLKERVKAYLRTFGMPLLITILPTVALIAFQWFRAH